MGTANFTPDINETFVLKEIREEREAESRKVIYEQIIKSRKMRKIGNNKLDDMKLLAVTVPTGFHIQLQEFNGNY